jgi:tetratricopeptide (TPR) repeat protein
MARKTTTFLLFALLTDTLLFAVPLSGQSPKAAPAASEPASTASAEKAIALAGAGHCKEAIPTLKRAVTGQIPEDAKKRAAVAGLNCSLSLDNRDSAMDFIRLLSREFPKDPDVLFILTHAYSDLSTREAQELAQTAPQSIPAHKLNAEALEMQGKWDDADREYQGMIDKEPNTPGLHFLLGRSLLSRPGADVKMTEQAKQEFQKEIEIDPKNAAAHYVLGELARRDENWDEAITQFSTAAKLDSNFAEAYLGWGFALVSVKRYQEAIAPLRVAERLTPGNPSVHYSLGTALIRTGQKEEAEKEFAIHRNLTAASQPPQSNEKPQ